MLPVRFVREARSEFDEARDWYERQSSGIGGLFEAAVDEKLHSVRQHPELYACVDGDVREAALLRFPYVIYF